MNINHTVRTRSTLIILNGPSCASKSSLQSALQTKLLGCFLALGLDTLFIRAVPSGYLPGGAITCPGVSAGDMFEGVKSQDAQGNPLFTLKFGAHGRKIISGMHRAIVGYLDAGNNVIVDYIAYEPNWLPELLELAKWHKVYLIGVTAPLEILESREKARGYDVAGHARSHYDTVLQYAPRPYDMMVDTSQDSAEVLAQKISEIV